MAIFSVTPYPIGVVEVAAIFVASNWGFRRHGLDGDQHGCSPDDMVKSTKEPPKAVHNMKSKIWSRLFFCKV